MKLSKRAEKLRDEEGFNELSRAQIMEPGLDMFQHLYRKGFNAGYSAARLEANVLEEALEFYADATKYKDVAEPMKSLGWTPGQIAKDALKKYRGEQE